MRLNLARLFILLSFSMVLLAALTFGLRALQRHQGTPVQEIPLEVSPARAGQSNENLKAWARQRPTEKPGGRNEVDP